MADIYNPFKKEDVDKGHWTFNTFMKLGALTGMAFGAYKIKGPTGRLALKYLDQYKNKIVSREAMKQFDSRERIISESASLKQPYFGIDIDEETQRSLDDVLDMDTATKFDMAEMKDVSYINYVKRAEDSIISRTEEDLGFARGAVRTPKGSRYPLKPAVDVTVDRDDILFTLRESTLYEHFARESAAREEDVATLHSIKSPASDKTRLKALHEYYLEYDSSYANLYQRRLNRMKSSYSMAKNAYDANPTTQTFTETNVRSFLYGGEEFDSTHLSVARQKVYSQRIGQGYNKHSVKGVNAFDLLAQDNNKITSGSLNRVAFVPDNKRFRLLSQFDYTAGLKKLSDKLNDLKTTRAADTQIKDVGFEIITKGSATDPKYYAKVSFEHNTKGRFSTEIPLAQHGRIPGSTPSVTEMLDGFYLKTEGDAIRRLNKKHSLGKDLRINEDIENKSQQMIRALNDILDSNMMENEFSINPDKAIRRIHFSMNNLLEDSPLAEGTIRDSFKAGRLVTESKFTKNQLLRLGNAHESMQNLGTLATAIKNREDVVNITFDFESISRDLPGPEWMARDEYTQLTKAGVVSSEFKNGKLVHTGADEFVSDHGYYQMKKYGWTEDTASWLRRELGDKSAHLTTPDEVGEAWGQQIRRQAENFRTSRGAPKFKDNMDFAEHIGESILRQVEAAVAANKKVFFTTKNGSQFDLHMLKNKAPKAWAKLQKYLKFIDVHSIAYYQKLGFGGEGSLALNKVIMRMMGRQGTDPINIDKPGQIRKAIDHFRRKGNIIIGDEMLTDWAQKGFLSQAHASPVVDSLFTNVMLIDEINKFQSGEKSYKNLSELQKFLLDGKRIMGLDESFEEAKYLERGYTIHGEFASASLLGQGQIAKQTMSMFSPNHLIPNSDNPMTKQWDQFYMGIKNRVSSQFMKSMKGRTDLEKRAMHRKYFRPSFISQGEIDAAGWKLKSDAMTNEFSHHIMTDSVSVFNSWRGQEGYNAFSQKVFDRHQFHIEKNVDLTSAQWTSADPHLSKRVLDLEGRVRKRVKELADLDGGSVKKSHWDIALKDVQADMDSKGLTIDIPRGTSLTMAQGDKSFVTTKAELDGVLRNVMIDRDTAGKIKVHGNLLFTAAGSDFNHVTFNYRSLLTKSTGVVDKWLSLGIAMGGAEHVSTADFIEKGYVGAQKNALIEKVFDKLLDQTETGTQAEKTRAEKVIKKISTEINSSFDKKRGVIIHNPETNIKFKNITDPKELAVAKKFIGNIDLSIEKLNGYMVDAGIIWDKQKAQNWYGMWADSDAVGSDNVMKSGRKNIEDWINQTVRNSTKDIDATLSNSKGALSSFHRDDLVNIKESMTPTLKTYFLPDIKRIDEGAKIPMFLEPIQKWTDRDDSPFIPGFRHRQRGAIYNIMKGRQPKPTDLKLRGGLLSLIDTPFGHVSRSTIDDLKTSRRFLKDKRFASARRTMDRFKDVLLSRAVSTSNMELNIKDINKLLDRVNRLDLNKLGRIINSDTAEAEMIQHVSAMLAEEGRSGEDLEKAVKSIIHELQTSKLAESFENNKNFVSMSAVQSWAAMAKDKGVFAYSAKKELGGAFEFHIADMLKNSELDPQMAIQQENKMMSMFKTMYDSAKDPSKGIVESIDETNKVVRLRKLVMHADTSPQNIYNVLNPYGKDLSIGYLSQGNKQQYKVIEAAKHYESVLSEMRSGSKGQTDVRTAESFLKRQYLNYMNQGFLMDSSSVYARANELAPRGVQAPIRGAADIIEKALDIQRRGGFATFGDQFKGSVTQANQLIKRLTSKSNLSDVYVTDAFFKNFELPMQINKANNVVKATEHLARVFGPDNAGKISSIMRGEEYLYGYMTRHPNVQSATDAVLDMRLNIIPQEVGEFLGMNANEAQVHAQYTKLFGADFDGDVAYFVMKGLKTAESLMGYGAEHSASLGKALDSVVSAKQGVVKSLRDSLKEKMFLMDITPGTKDGVLMGGFDDQGNFITKSMDINSQKTMTMFANDFQSFAENIKTIQLHNPNVITAKYIGNQMDRVAHTAVSKNVIGLMTNVAYTRSRQLLQAGLIGKDSVAAKALMGNLNHGYAGIAQTFISLAKHPNADFGRLASAAKVFLDPKNSTREDKNSLKNLFTDMYGADEGQSYYKKSIGIMREMEEIAPRGSQLFDMKRSFDNIDLVRDNANIADIIISAAEKDFMLENKFSVPAPTRSAVSELGDQLSKKFKLDTPNARSFFKKGGKVGAIAAGIYMAATFFKPNQLSNSANPLDAFTDLGVDIDGSHNAISSSVELNRNIPLDMVDASFSKQAFIRLNSNRNNKRQRSSVISRMIDNTVGTVNQNRQAFFGPPNNNYSNYTSYIPQFGSSQLDRRADL
jgi:hypothetical protein